MLTHNQDIKPTTCESDHLDSQNSLKSVDAGRAMQYIWQLMTWLAKEF